MPRASRRSQTSPTGEDPNRLERTHSSRQRRRRRRWLRFCRLLAKKKWRGIGATGVVTILLAALLLCLTAYFESWGQDVSPSSALDSSAPAPSTEDPEYFEDVDIPPVFQEYAALHNSATASPFEANYVLYEIPGNFTLAHSLLGLTSAYLYALLSDRVLLVQWTADFEAPPTEGSSGNTTGDGSGSSAADRTSSLEEILLDPGFYWSWERFEDRWINYFGYPEEDLVITHVNVMENYNSVVCNNLKKGFMKDEQFIKIVNSEYFAPLLSVNQHGSSKILEEIPSGDMFAILSNWLLRPVAPVTNAVRRFKERYLEDNYVIGIEMNVLTDTSDTGIMPQSQQELFFKEASDASFRAREDLPDQQGIVSLVVTDDEAALRERLGSTEDSLSAKGVIAILPSRGYGTIRILTELQQAWLLGYADVCIVTAASAIGVLGHARMSRAPIVIEDSTTAHQSTSSQPCLADVGKIQHATCFVPSMLSRLSYDPNVPCLGNPPSTVTSSDESRARMRRLEL